MELRQLFPMDLLSDHSLVAAWTYCVREVPDSSTTQRVAGQIIKLDRNQILVNPDRVKLDIGMAWESFLGFIEILKERQMLRYNTIEHGAILEILNIAFPITQVQNPRDLQSGLRQIKVNA